MIETKCEYGIELAAIEEIKNNDAVVLAVAHDRYRSLTLADLDRFFKDVQNKNKVIIDIKGLLLRSEFEAAGFRSTGDFDYSKEIFLDYNW